MLVEFHRPVAIALSPINTGSTPGGSLDLSRINSLAELEKLLELLSKFDIHEIEIESESRKLRLSKPKPSEAGGGGVTVVSGGSALPVAAQPEVASAPAPQADSQDAASSSSLPAGVEVITSPMVGTFYLAPSPEADPFVRAGDRVQADTVLGIIEAMKVMNEIPAGKSGVIQEILVENGGSVEFGQPLFHISAS